MLNRTSAEPAPQRTDYMAVLTDELLQRSLENALLRFLRLFDRGICRVMRKSRRTMSKE